MPRMASIHSGQSASTVPGFGYSVLAPGIRRKDREYPTLVLAALGSWKNRKTEIGHPRPTSWIRSLALP